MQNQQDCHILGAIIQVFPGLVNKQGTPGRGFFAGKAPCPHGADSRSISLSGDVMGRKQSRPVLRAGVWFWAGICGLFCLCGARSALPFLAAAGLHEAGHLGALWLLGIPVEAVELGLGGAVIRAELRGRGREALALMAGPWVNLLCAGLFFRLLPDFARYSFVLFLYNLLPVSALDGGRICSLALPRLFGPAGEVLCQLLHWGTVVGAVLLGLWGTWGLRLGLWPMIAAGIFLLRLPLGVDKPAEGW